MIREARPLDAIPIAEVHIRSWQETYRGLMTDFYLDNLPFAEGTARCNFWKGYLSDPANARRTWVAEENGDIVGFVNVGPNRDQTPVADGEINAIYLIRAHQKKGIGRKLFEVGMNQLKQFGLSSASLWVVRGNETENFYRHMGGVANGEMVEQCGGAKNIPQLRYVFKL